MQLVCDRKAIKEVLEPLGISVLQESTVTLYGCKCVHCDDAVFYMVEDQNAAQEMLVVTLTKWDVWELDKFQGFVGLKKRYVQIKENRLEETAAQDCFIYTRRGDESSVNVSMDVQTARACRDKNFQMGTCDLYLLIPGKICKEPGTWERIPQRQRDAFSVYQTCIEACVEDEYNSAFAKCLERKCIGEVTLCIHDRTDGNTYLQKALLGIVKHKTGICALEVIVQNCMIGGNKILNYYCGNLLEFLLDGKTYTLQQLFDFLRIRRYGKKRSIMFAYGEVEEREIINALANEEFPMGNIGGDFLRSVQECNIAQYDTAEVFVSHETMLEVCKSMDADGDLRFAYHAIEIFFLELILFQDAAIDKVCLDIEREIELQRGNRDVKSALEQYDQISFDMAKAILFGDYEQFNFPTVRESAKKVAKNFGVDSLNEKYKTSEALLKMMINANKRKSTERQESLKSKFLLLLSAVSTISVIADLVLIYYNHDYTTMLANLISLGVIIAGFGIYKLTGYIIDIHLSQKKETR